MHLYVQPVMPTSAHGKTMTDKEFRKGIDSKLMGQINLILIGRNYINPGGSFTLTSGVLTHDPVLSGANPSAPMVR
jgi:hypothetical protein